MRADSSAGESTRLISVRSVVRVHFSPPLLLLQSGFKFNIPWGCSSAGRAPALQAGGQEFDSPHLHQELIVPNFNHLKKKG